MDIRLQLAFRNNPKVIDLEADLGDAGVLALITVWCWAAEHRNKGVFYGVSDLAIEKFAMWRGEPLKFVEKCVKLHLFDRDAENQLKIHDWRTHQPFVFNATTRIKVARQNAQRRWEKKGKHANGNANSMRTACNPHNDCNALYSTLLNTTQHIYTPDEFEAFYAAYPKRVARKRAEAAYAKVRKATSADELLNGAKRYAVECKGRDVQYIKHPATWLNAGCWADEQAPVDAPEDYSGGWKPSKGIDDAEAEGLVPLGKAE